mmetsp:Transcript_12058/g.34855  ORF Transcript_12058/g.34855 Transcript_12058/m.34855 type:complete len:236 (+) Transcript_12058:372-1079(+)
MLFSCSACSSFRDHASPVRKPSIFSQVALLTEVEREKVTVSSAPRARRASPPLSVTITTGTSMSRPRQRGSTPNLLMVVSVLAMMTMEASACLPYSAFSMNWHFPRGMTTAFPRIAFPFLSSPHASCGSAATTETGVLGTRVPKFAMRNSWRSPEGVVNQPPSIIALTIFLSSGVLGWHRSDSLFTSLLAMQCTGTMAPVNDCPLWIVLIKSPPSCCWIMLADIGRSWASGAGMW